jgi:hypothetical protein
VIAARYLDELKLGNVSDEDFLTFCYKASICDPDDLEQGLFKGTFLQHVCIMISLEHGHLVDIFDTDISMNLYWTSICFEEQAQSSHKEEVQCGYYWSDTGDTLVNCLCSCLSKSYLCIIAHAYRTLHSGASCS